MKLLSVAWECPEGFYGGLGTVVSRLLPAFSELGIETLHICTEGVVSGCKQLGGYSYCRTTPTIPTNDMGVYIATASVLGYQTALYGRLFDIVVGHDIHGALSVLVGREFGLKTALFLHLLSGSGIEAEAANVADALFTNSKLMAGSIEEAYGVKPRVLYFPPPYPLQPIDEDKFSKKREPTLLIFTRYQDYKDPGWVLEILDKLYRKGMRFRCVLAGIGTDLYGYRYPWLDVLGTVSEEKKIELMRSSDLLIYPSRWEPYGLVPLEAIALGTPAIVSRGCGVAEVLSGYELIDPDDEKTTIEILEMYIASSEDRLSLLSVQRKLPVVNKTWVDVAKEILEALGVGYG